MSNDLLRSLLTIAAAEPDAERFARVVNAAQRGKVVLDEQAVLMTTSLEKIQMWQYSTYSFHIML